MFRKASVRQINVTATEWFRWSIAAMSLAVMAIVLAACSSGDAPTLATDAVESETDAVAVPVSVDGRLELEGTAWVFEEALGVGRAYEPETLSFFGQDNVLRFSVTASCGNGVGTISESAVGFNVDNTSWTDRQRCDELAAFFDYRLNLELDDLGRLIVRGSGAGRTESALVFSHVQSTSINSDPIDRGSSAAVFAATLTDSRWTVVESTGVAEAANQEQGELEQVISFGRHNGEGIVISLSYGCQHDDRVITWNESGFAVTTAGGQFDMSLLEGPPCEDEADGLLAVGLPRVGAVAVSTVDGQLQLAGTIENDEWTLTLAEWQPTSQDPAFIPPPECNGYRVGDLETDASTFTETLPDGSLSEVTLDGFVVELVSEHSADLDSDGNNDSVHHLRLRDRNDPNVRVDVIGTCGVNFDLPQAIVRIHPNTVVELDWPISGDEFSLTWNDSQSLYRSSFSIEGGELVGRGETAVGLDSPEVQERLVVTSQPLAADAEGDRANGVLHFGSLGCIELRGANTAGLVFPVDRSSWDPVELAVIVDGERYRSGDRVEIIRLPRPEFLDYFNPAERTQCGIDNHVVVSIGSVG